MSSENEFYSYFSYIGPFWFVGLLSGSRNRTLRFHINQGLVLFITELAAALCAFSLVRLIGLLDIGIIGTILGWIPSLAALAYAFCFSVIGMLHVAKGEKKPLPLIGGIKLLK